MAIKSSTHPPGRYGPLIPAILNSALFMGRLGEALENGDEYDRREAHEVALTLLEERVRPS
jgi:hypothetical protein